jgi:hypothetical protein
MEHPRAIQEDGRAEQDGIAGHVRDEGVPQTEKAPDVG